MKVAAVILVVALLTVLIIVLALISLNSLLKAEKLEIEAGHKDEELLQAECMSTSKKQRVLDKVYGTLSWFIIGILSTFTAVAIVYRVNNNQITINNYTNLVIASDSMNGFYDDKYEYQLTQYKPDAIDQQFETGDILKFEKVNDDDIIVYDVYGYENSKGQIITHRCIEITEDGWYRFRGDNTPGCDSLVKRESIKLHYTGSKTQRLGLFILFSKSGFGIYAALSVLAVYIIADIYTNKYSKLVNARLAELKRLEDERRTYEPAVENTNMNLSYEYDPNRILLADFIDGKGRRKIIYAKQEND